MPNPPEQPIPQIDKIKIIRVIWDREKKIFAYPFDPPLISISDPTDLQ